MKKSFRVILKDMVNLKKQRVNEFQSLLTNTSSEFLKVSEFSQFHQCCTESTQVFDTDTADPMDFIEINYLVHFGPIEPFLKKKICWTKIDSQFLCNSCYFASAIHFTMLVLLNQWIFFMENCSVGFELCQRLGIHRYQCNQLR